MENEYLENGALPQELPEQPEKPNRAKSFFQDCRDIVYILAIFMFVYVLCFRMVVVDGDSMNNTLVHGDRLLLLSNVLYWEPKQGDVIVASKDSFRNGECIIKRVIAVEGQTVDINFETGDVFVDGELLDEDYICSPTMLPEGTVFPLTVSEGCVFVMGDNRMDSTDSRNPRIGQIDRREILGKAVLLLLPGQDENHEMDFGRIGVVN